MDNSKKQQTVSGQASLEALKKISLSGLIILKKEFEKEKEIAFNGLSLAESIEKVYKLQGKIQILNSFIARIDFILKK